MNFISYVISFLGLSVALSETFFLLKVKTEPDPLFCVKVCPLYCHSRSKRDVGPPEHYFDTEEEPWHDVAEDIEWPSMPIPHYSPYFFCHPHPTTSKPQPTKPPMPTTTGEPTTFICQLCKAKCNYPK